MHKNPTELTDQQTSIEVIAPFPANLKGGQCALQALIKTNNVDEVRYC